MQPKYGLNKRLEGDIKYITQLYGADEQRAYLRRNTIAKLERAISRYGSRYHLEEIGPATWGPGIPSRCPSFVLIDKQYPNGPPADTPLSVMPKAYDPFSVMRKLQKEGFEGGVEEYSIEEEPIGPWETYSRQSPPRFSNHLVLWKDWEPNVRPGFLAPIRLVVFSTNETLPFILHLCDPAALVRNQLMIRLFKRPEFLDLWMVLNIWARSWKMGPLHSVLAYLIIRFLQSLNAGRTFEGHTPGDDDEEYREFIDRLAPSKAIPVHFDGTVFRYPDNDDYSDPNDPIAQNITVNTQIRVPRATVKVGKLLTLFFRHYMDKGVIISLKRKQSIYAGHSLPRSLLPENGPPDLDGPIVGRRRNPFLQEPPHWGGAPMVCLDLFVPHWNQAECVSWGVIQYFMQRVRAAYASLSTRDPLSSIFGPYLTVPSSHMRRIQTFIPPPRATTADTSERRSQILRRVQSVIQSVYGTTFTVKMFGSTQYGVSHEESDLDLVIVDADRPKGFSPDLDLDRLPEIYDIRHLADILKQKGFIIKQVIRHAYVPVVKFVDPVTDIPCDIIVNDQLGLINTRLIGFYCQLCPPLREMLVRIKVWAKNVGLNDPSGRRGGGHTFSSYALTLMTIGFLQMKGLLPNLQAKLGTRKKGEDLFWTRRGAGSTGCDIRYKHRISWPTPDNLNVGHLLREWFQYWAEDFDYDTCEMNIRRGGPVNRQLERYKLRKLVVPDPFIWFKNCTGAISFANLERFRSECRRAMFFDKYGSLDAKAFVGDGDDESDGEDIFPNNI